MNKLCERFGYTRQAYYKSQHSNEREAIDESVIVSLIAEIRADKDLPRAGGRKLHSLLREEGFLIGRDRLFEILRSHGLLVKIHRRAYVTTNSHYCMRKYPNLIKGLAITHSNKVWVSDITYIRIREDKFAYLSLITDAYTHQIVGWCLHSTLDTTGPLQALTMAMANEKIAPWTGLIHHSDKGTQYCSAQYINMLRQTGISISMTEKGNPYENAIAERTNGILKREWINQEKYDNMQTARARIGQIISAYNCNRPHLSLDMKTPMQAKAYSGTFKKLWKNYYQINNFVKSSCQPIPGLQTAQHSNIQ